MDMAYSEGGERNGYTDFVSHNFTVGYRRLKQASFILPRKLDMANYRR
jgi:hypothetical protein